MPEEPAGDVADAPLLAVSEVAVDVQGDLGGLVTERRLHLLHAAPGVDQGAGDEVAQVVKT